MTAEPLWAGLAALCAPTDLDAKTLPCVRLELRSGTVFDVYRADQVSAGANIWRVRGFIDTQEQRALLLGTTDGRAMINFGNALTPETMGDNTVASATSSTRPIEDLSEVMATAIRALFKDAPN